MPGSLVYVPTLIEDKLALDEKAVGIKHWKDLRKARERKAKAMPNPEQCGCTPYPEEGEVYAFLAVNSMQEHYQRIRYRGYHNMKALVKMAHQHDDDDIIICKFVRIQGKRFKRAILPVKAAIASGEHRRLYTSVLAALRSLTLACVLQATSATG